MEQDAELIAGRRPVEEAFVARRPARRLLVVPERRPALEALVLHATTLRIPVVEVEGGSLTSLSGFDGHQGIALVVEPRRSATLDEVLARARERGERPFLLVLDSLEDPHNVGSLLRSAEACGVHGIIFPTRRSAPISPSALKSSAGAIEHLLLVAVDDLAGTLVDLRGRGLRLVGADEGAALSYRDADLRGPIAIVVGSEGHGLSGHVRRRLDLSVQIPMRGRVASLNAAVAGSIVLFEAAGQRQAGFPLSGPERLEASEERHEPENAPSEEWEHAADADDAPDADEGSGVRADAAEGADATAADDRPEEVAAEELLPGEPGGPGTSAEGR